MKRPNPFPTARMTPAERRTELCELLALGLVRLRMRDRAQVSAGHGELSLHNSPHQRAHATPINRRPA